MKDKVEVSEPPSDEHVKNRRPNRARFVFEIDLDTLTRVEYGCRKLVEFTFGIHAERLEQLCDSKAVRSIKFGDSRQSQRLYSFDDIREWLTKQAMNALNN